ncbi:hypothetical protein WS9_003880 [Paraclostridium sordellii 8483]|uniref:hypothetical protein n=1 Tax=Paraclostridium sordellii TaxID=1505 RepID=UPI0002E2F4FC|nr:hypothetical protein [Paeniclostridium sordellii]TAN69169.1 hypothetical protein WS9_003880 [Paeniclostridium sordellii 8483]
MKNEWLYNIDGSEIWTSDSYENKEDCIAAAIDEALEQGEATFSIGRAKSVGSLPIDAENVIEDLQDIMYDLVGPEVSETFLSCIDKSEIEDLSNRLTSVFYDWCKENKIDNGEGYFTMVDIEEIKYCANCKKVIENEEDSSELIEVPGEYMIEAYYFHKECDYIPIDHLDPTLIGEVVNRK